MSLGVYYMSTRVCFVYIIRNMFGILCNPMNTFSVGLLFWALGRPGWNPKCPYTHRHTKKTNTNTNTRNHNQIHGNNHNHNHNHKRNHKKTPPQPQPQKQTLIRIHSQNKPEYKCTNNATTTTTKAVITTTNTK